MASDDHAGKVLAFLEEVCERLEKHERPRSWQDFVPRCALPIAIGIGIGTVSCSGGDLYGAPYESVCDDGTDNDQDKRIDCDDPDCAHNPACTDGGAVETACSDGADDDGDQLVDCADPDCADDPACT